MNENMLRYVLRRDFSDGERPICKYCKEPLNLKKGKKHRHEGKKVVLDHLDNNSKNDNYWNLALVHQGCNQAKRTNTDYQIIAHDAIAENKEYVPLPSEDGTHHHENTNIRTGNKLYTHAKEYLERELPDETSPPMLVDDMCDDMAYLAQEKFHCGSQSSMKRHLFSLCSDSAPWQITSPNGRPIVSRRPPLLIKYTKAGKKRRKDGRSVPRRANAGERVHAGGGSGRVGGTDPRGPKAPARKRRKRDTAP